MKMKIKVNIEIEINVESDYSENDIKDCINENLNISLYEIIESDEKEMNIKIDNIDINI